MAKAEPPDLYEVMDILCAKFLVDGGKVHGFDVLNDVNVYMHEADEKIEKKIRAIAGEHKVRFHYGPPSKTGDTERR